MKYLVSIYNGTEWENIFSSDYIAEAQIMGWLAYKYLREPHEDCVVIDASTGEILEDFHMVLGVFSEEDM